MANEEMLNEKKAEEKKEEEKKPNAFSKFWNKTKQAVSDSMLEAKLDSDFRKTHDEFTIYEYGKMMGKTYAGTLEGDKVTLYGKIDVASNSVLVSKKDNKAYYTVVYEESTVEVESEGEKYTRPSTTIFLDENVTEVKVIKASDKYYIYKG